MLKPVEALYDGAYCRRKWDTEEPPIPLPIIHTVGGGSWEVADGTVRKQRNRGTMIDQCTMYIFPIGELQGKHFDETF